MVGEEDLRLCLGMRAVVSGCGDHLLPVASDGGGRRTHETQDRGGGGGEGEEKCHGEESDEEGGGTGASAAGRRKLRLSKQQASILEDAFRRHHTLNPKNKLALAKELNLKPRQVEVWFQNKRARTKLKKTEVDCELLKRGYESLTQENRRLQRELLELRALKRATPQPTTIVLALCPSCEGVAPSTVAAMPTKSKYKNQYSTHLPLQHSRLLLS